jgi:hypothetical protein
VDDRIAHFEKRETNPGKKRVTKIKVD